MIAQQQAWCPPPPVPSSSQEQQQEWRNSSGLSMRGFDNIDNVVGRRRPVAKLVVGDQDDRVQGVRIMGGRIGCS